MSTPFKVDIDDVEFVFFDQLGVDTTLARTDAFGELDRETYRATFQEIRKMAEDVLHPINRPGDRQGCTLDGEGNVRTPKGYGDAWKRMRDAGFIGPAAPVDVGGGGMPRVLSSICTDLYTGACTAFMMYQGLTAAAGRVVRGYAPEKWRELVATKLFSGEWGGTMCLTESGAGSSVGDNRCKAAPVGDGVYHLEGEKIFISGGDQDLTSNIVHMVLARTPGSPTGTKGLSLFLVPKFIFDDAGNLGARNGAKVVGIEHKMGINGSATCTLALGAETPCKAWMVGTEREGISLMFHMMNEARIGVALQGVATCNAAYGYAVRYATDRIQGQHLRHMRDPESSRVAIIEHPDVRRMLMTMQVIAATTRAACYRMAFMRDRSQTTSDEAERAALEERMDLLIPVLKAHCTDLSSEMATLAVQVYGGYGYIGEFPVEQVLRDSKIQSIYEGTNGIQALDLLGRKMRTKGGALFMAWMKHANEQLAAAKAEGFGDQADAIGKALGQLGACAMHLGKLAGEGKIEGAFVHAVPFLKTFGVVLLAMEAVDQAVVAKRVAAERGPSALTTRKIAGLDFYVHHVLPQAVAFAKTVQSGDASPMTEGIFALPERA